MLDPPALTSLSTACQAILPAKFPLMTAFFVCVLPAPMLIPAAVTCVAWHGGFLQIERFPGVAAAFCARAQIA